MMVTLKKAHKCQICGKLMPIGTMAVMTEYKKTKYYPVKGIMGFWVYHFQHLECK